MSQIYKDNSLSIGGTPLVRLNRITPGKATVYARSRGAIRPTVLSAGSARQ
jgi:cysteine synthase